MVQEREKAMNTRGDRNRYVSRIGVAVWMGLLAMALAPAPARAQWTHNGNTSIDGKLGVGTQNPARGIHLQSGNAVFRMDRDRDSAAFMIVRTAAAISAAFGNRTPSGSGRTEPTTAISTSATWATR